MKWKKVRLESIADIRAGGTPSRNIKEYWLNGNIPWIKISDIKNKMVTNAEEKITALGLENSSAKLFGKGTILYTIFATLGKVGILDIDAATNQAIAGIEIVNENVDREFLYYYFKDMEDYTYNRGRGVAQNNINLSILKDFEVPLPPLETQKKIAKLLDKAQELIDKRQEQIALLDDFIQSVFIDMFGDPVSNPKGWIVKTLSDTGDLKRGKSKHRPRNATELFGGEYPLIQTGDVANSGVFIKKYHQTYSEIGLKQSKLWAKGTLCITIAANIADTGILLFDACFPDSIVAYLPREDMNKYYVQFWLMFLKEIVEYNAPESAQKNINLRILSSLEIPVPPLDLQNQFAQIVEKTEEQRDLLEKSLTEMENNFNSIMQRAFRGEIF